jgi:hypothetical protein
MCPSSDFLENHHLYNQKYRLRGSGGCSAMGSTLLRLTGSSVLFTAPHSVTQLRAGREKLAELWTGAIAESLSTIMGANVVTALSPRIETENAATADDFRRVVDLLLHTQCIELVFDIHGLGAYHGHDIYLGSAGFSRPELIDGLYKDLSREFKVGVDPSFNGDSGLTGFINGDRTTRARALQLELGPRLRSSTTQARDLNALAECLGKLQELMLRELHQADYLVRTLELPQ